MTCHGTPDVSLGSTGFTNQEFSAPANLGTKAPSAATNNKPIKSVGLAKAIRDSATEYFTHDPENAKKALELAKHQRATPLKGGGAIAKAREEVHTTGTSHMKVRLRKRPRWENAKKTSGPDVRADKLARRNKSIPDELKHEGWLDFTLKHVVAVDEKAFTDAVGGIIDTVRSKINNTKSLFETIVGIDGATFMRYLVASACAVATGVFAYQSVACASWIPAVLAGIAAVCGVYAMRVEIFDYATTVLQEYVIKNYGPEYEIPEYSTEVVDRAVAKFLAGERITDEDMVDNGVKPESGNWLHMTGLTILADVIQALLVGGVGFAVMGRKERFVESLSKVPRITSGISALIELIMKWVSEIIDRAFGSNLKSFFNGNQDLEAWAKEVMETSEQHDQGQLELCPGSAARVQRLVQIGRELAVNKSLTTTLGIQMHRAATKELDKLHLIHNKAGIGKESKPEPLGILIMGESGVGKSFTTQRLMKYTGIRLMNKPRREAFMEDFNSEVWACCNEEEHANGYKGQFFCVIDDLGQHKVAPGAKTDALTVIRFINSNPQKLNMAALHEKGNVSFTSEMIFASTNLYSFWDQNIVQPEAFLRRWSEIVIMAPKKEWCTEKTKEGPIKERRLDYSLLEGGFNRDVAEFHLQEIVDVVQQTYKTKAIMDLDAFEDHVVQLYMKKKEAHLKLIDSIQKEAEAKLALIEKEEEAALEYQCGFETYEQMDAAGLPQRTWSEWASQSVKSLRKTFAACVFKPVMKRVVTLRSMLAIFQKEVIAQYGRVCAMSAQEKVLLISLFVILTVAFITCIVPMIRKSMSSNNGDGEDHQALLKRSEEVPDLDAFIQLVQTDNKNRLKKVGVKVDVSEAGKEKHKQFLIKEGLKNTERKLVYTLLHTGKKRVITHVLDQKYQSMLFAQPSAYSQFATNYVSGLFRRNVYHMYTGTRTVDEPSGGKVTIVKDALMLINKHFIYEIKAAALNDKTGAQCIRFVPHAQPTKEILIPYTHFVDPANVSGMDTTEDAVLVDCQAYMSPHRDITSKFVSNLDSEAMRDHEFTVYVPPSPSHMKQHDVLGHYADTVPVGKNRHKGMFWYQAPTVDGDCGGLVLESRDRDSCSRIVGIHAAGENRNSSSKLAFAQRVSREYLHELASKWPRTVATRPMDDGVDYEASTFMSLDVVRKDTKHNILNVDCSLVPSFMHGWRGEPTRVPARMSPFTNSAGEYKVPLEIALRGELSNNVPIDPKMVDACVNHLANKLLPFMKRRGKVLTVEEGINGLPDSPLRPIQRATSAGYYGLHNPEVKPGKRGAFGADGPYTLDTPEAKRLIAKVEADWEQMKQGKPVDAPYLLFMKQEKRSLSKVEAGKARLVKAASVDDAINMRRAYGAFIADLMEFQTLCGVAVGINPLGRDWNGLVEHVQKKGKWLIAGDFGSFDATQTRQHILAVLRTMAKAAGHKGREMENILACIAETLASPRCMIGNVVYQNDHSMPSGNIATSIINSLHVQLLMSIAWILLMKEEGETFTACLQRYEEHVTVVSYGDDHLINVTDEAVVKFNQLTLMAIFPTIGMVYTSDNKEDKNPPPCRTIEEVTFLKRSFRWEERLGTYVAPLDEQTLCEVCYYADIKGAPKAVTRDNVERTFRELSLHGKEKYEELATALEAAHNERATIPVLKPDFESALSEVMGELPGFDTNAV